MSGEQSVNIHINHSIGISATPGKLNLYKYFKIYLKIHFHKIKFAYLIVVVQF